MLLRGPGRPGGEGAAPSAGSALSRGGQEAGIWRGTRAQGRWDGGGGESGGGRRGPGWGGAGSRRPSLRAGAAAVPGAQCPHSRTSSLPAPGSARYPSAAEPPPASAPADWRSRNPASPGLLRSLSFLLPSAKPRDASAAPGPLRRGRLLPAVRREKTRKAEGADPAHQAPAAGEEGCGAAGSTEMRPHCPRPRARPPPPRPGPPPARGRPYQQQPLGSSPMSRGPEPRPSPSPEQLGVCAAG